MLFVGFSVFFFFVFCLLFVVFFFQAEDGIRDRDVTGVQTCLFRSEVILSRLNTCRCIQTVSNIAVARVSVLDLDNSVRFSLGYIQVVEEKTRSKCLPNKCQEPDRDHPHTRGDQTVLIIVSL